ncbi:MAG: ABC transporter permease, partial [Faecalimonas sp.]|nr:ABC transporter permease [Faecalimonas sp.]
YVDGEEVPNEEEIKVESTRTYKVVGIYERPSFEGHTAPGYTAITVADKEFGEAATFDVYFKMKKPADVYKFMEDRAMNGTTNNDVLMFMGVSQFGNFSDVLISLAVIVIALIMFGSVSLIYNAFAISVSERTKQFGLLSSIGATKKQLKKMVLFEALAVSVIGIPLGILVGIGGIGVTLLLIGDKFNSMISGYPEPMRICVSWGAILAAVLVALVTVLISAWIPSKRATKVSAVEAIRQNMDIKAKNKQVKTSKLTYKLFGLPGVIASKHYKRNKKKYRTTVISLFMSIVLFVSTSAFSDYLMESVTGGFEKSGYDLSFIAHESELRDKTADELLEIVLAEKDVTKGSYAAVRNYTASVSNDYVTDEYRKSRGEQQVVEEGFSRVSGYFYFVNDDEFDKLLKQYKLNKSDYYNTDAPLAIAMDTNRQFNFTTEKYENMDALKGDENELICKVTKEEGDVYYTLKTGKAISEKPFFMTDSGGGELNMIYPVSMYEYVVPKEAQVDDIGYDYILCSDNHAASYKKLETILLENNLNPKNLVDVAENEESLRNTILIMQVFAYGFIVLISLIAAANVFNTISTNISLRRREFAMLKSVGMTQKGFNKMMNFECLLYGSKALLLGLPVSAGITYLIYLAISDGFETTYHLPWTAIGISVLSVFLVVFVTMLYSMSKIKKENPIDALKNENL